MSIVFVSFRFPVNVSELNLPKANVQEIEDAGAHLPEPELDEFRVWFEKFDAEFWDKPLKKDVANGN